MKICIDPGHSGTCEPGVCAGEVTEASICLGISKALGGMLHLLGYEVIYTRERDIKTDDLGFRAQVANDNGADAFVSIHCNSAESIEANGIEIYHHPDSEKGMALAALIEGVFIQTIPLRDRGVKEADFAVLRLIDMPAVLVECGFLSSENDRNFLMDEKNQISIGLGIAAGINRYFTINK